MKPEKVHLTEEKQTLLISLYAKALESRSVRSLLNDRLADQVIRRIDYDFSRLQLDPDSTIGIAVRAKALDGWTRAFIERSPHANVLNLGCGLDSRLYRIDPPPGVSWFDVDFPEVIDVRRRLYPSRRNCRLVAASVTDPDWLDQVECNRPAMIVAEGLMPYLATEDVPKLLLRLVAHFPSGELVFDGYSEFGLQLLRLNPQILTTGAEVHWAIDDPRELENAVPGLRLVEEKSEYDPDDVARMSWSTQVLIALWPYVPMLARIGRLFRYRF